MDYHMNACVMAWLHYVTRVDRTQTCNLPPFQHMPEELQLSDLQISVLRALWARQSMTVPELWQVLHAERGLAQSTVATVLSRLEKRGVVAREGEGRPYVYRAMVTEEEVRRAMVAGLTSLLFRGDPGALVAHLLETEQIGAEDLDYVRALIEAAEEADDER